MEGMRDGVIPHGYISSVEYAKKNGMSKSAVQTALQRKKITGVKVGGRWFLPDTEYTGGDELFPDCPLTTCKGNEEGKCQILTECLYRNGRCPFAKFERGDTMNALKYHMTAAQKKILKDRVATEIDVQMKDYLIDYDAQWLACVAEHCGWKKKRIEALYKAFYEIRRREKEFYGAKGYEGVLEHSATDALRNIGVDIRELAREYGEPVVKTEIKR